MGPYGSLRGHHSLETAWEVKSDLRFEISDPNYLFIHVRIVYMVWALFGSLQGHYSLQTALEAKCDLGFEISEPNYQLIHVHIVDIV